VTELSAVKHGRREFGERHYDKLPQPIRAAVMKAVVADLQERLARARRRGRREFGERHYDKLPQPIRAAVMKAVVADLQERLARARRLMK
jgi:hypothetical protein